MAGIMCAQSVVCFKFPAYAIAMSAFQACAWLRATRATARVVYPRRLFERID